MPTGRVLESRTEGWSSGDALHVLTLPVTPWTLSSYFHWRQGSQGLPEIIHFLLALLYISGSGGFLNPDLNPRVTWEITWSWVQPFSSSLRSLQELLWLHRLMAQGLVKGPSDSRSNTLGAGTWQTRKAFLLLLCFVLFAFYSGTQPWDSSFWF